MNFTCRTLKSNVTCKEEFPEECVPAKPLTNPILGCCKDVVTDNCQKYTITAKGFFSSYTQKIEDDVLDGAKNLIYEVGNIHKWIIIVADQSNFQASNYSGWK